MRTRRGTRAGQGCPGRERRKGGVAALVLLTLLGCGSDAGPTDPPTAACAPEPAATAFFGDLSNTGTGADLVARLGPPTTLECTTRLSVFVAREGAVLDAVSAAALPADRTVALPLSFTQEEVDFGATGVDAAGEPIQEGRSYVLQLLAVGDGVDPVVTTGGAAVDLANVDAVRTVSPVIDAGSGGLQTDADGNVYTADFGATLSGPPGSVIHRVTPDGSVSVFARGFQGASGNDRGADGDLFQSNIQGGTVSRVTPGGGVTTFARGISAPVGIVALPGDTLLVTGCGDNTIRRVEPDGSVSVLTDSGLLNCPNGITLADDGNYYIANFSDGWVLRMTPGGAVSRVAQVGSGNAGHLLWGQGALWVVDRGGHQLVRMTLSGESQVVAGTGTRGGRDGPAVQATLSLPNDVAFSPSGDRLYFNDVATYFGDQATINPVVVRALILARP